jgi:hypothetical protein
MTARFRCTQAVLIGAVLVIFMLSVGASYQLGHDKRMFGYPVYRWRESMAIALSRMQETPLHGYLAYRSIRDYLAQNGLGIFTSEMNPVPTQDQLNALVNDTSRIEGLIRGALTVPINYSLAPVTLLGNEKGLADFYYIAFTLFGVHISSLVVFYYSLLLISVGAYIWSFRNSVFCMTLLMFYLIGHFYMVEYYSTLHDISVVHNSRFFPVLSFLPAMHLLLLVLGRVKPSLGLIAAGILQTIILMFVVLCREEAAWQVMAVLAAPILVASGKPLFEAIRRPRLLHLAVRDLALSAWPSIVMMVGVVSYFAYLTVMLDNVFYKTETKSHVFWHSLYSGTISASPELYKLYDFGGGLWTDEMVYDAVMADLRARDEDLQKNPSDPAWKIAFRVNGVIYINTQHDVGVYDSLVRHIYLNVFREHPWLVLESFVVWKPYEQLTIFPHTPLWRMRTYVPVLLLALSASLLTGLMSRGVPRRGDVIKGIQAIVLVAIFSAIPSLIVASDLIVDTVLFYLITAMIGALFYPILYLVRFAQGRVSAQVAKATWDKRTSSVSSARSA